MVERQLTGRAQPVRPTLNTPAVTREHPRTMPVALIGVAPSVRARPAVPNWHPEPLHGGRLEPRHLRARPRPACLRSR